MSSVAPNLASMPILGTSLIEVLPEVFFYILLEYFPPKRIFFPDMVHVFTFRIPE